MTLNIPPNIPFAIRRSEPPFYYNGKMLPITQDEFELDPKDIKWVGDLENATTTTDFRSLTRTANYLWSLGFDVEKVVAMKG